jgi:WD40 repeat protein
MFVGMCLLNQFWTYEDGEMTHMGLGHSAPITGIAVSPDQGSIISISSDGAIHCWKFPPRKTPTPDVTATTGNTAEAQLGPIYDDEDDPNLVPDNVAKEFLTMVETKAGVIMPAQEQCTEPQI